MATRRLPWSATAARAAFGFMCEIASATSRAWASMSATRRAASAMRASRIPIRSPTDVDAATVGARWLSIRLANVPPAFTITSPATRITITSRSGPLAHSQFAASQATITSLVISRRAPSTTIAVACARRRPTRAMTSPQETAQDRHRGRLSREQSTRPPVERYAAAAASATAVAEPRDSPRSHARPVDAGGWLGLFRPAGVASLGTSAAALVASAAAFRRPRATRALSAAHARRRRTRKRGHTAHHDRDAPSGQRRPVPRLNRPRAGQTHASARDPIADGRPTCVLWEFGVDNSRTRSASIRRETALWCTEPLNSMADKRSTPVKVPESEVARQATDALEGYVYQLDHTVMTWLTLGDDEALHIEFAEDVAISKDGKLDLTQIKRRGANITLRSDSVAKLITSVWGFQKKNPDRQVSGALLTTSSIGKEKRMSFPGKLPGLVYWRTAARAGADVEPIRMALLSLELPKDLKTFIESATADQLRNSVIRPIHWVEDSANQEELRRDVEERLVLLGSRMGVPAAASKNARHFLIGALLDSLGRPAGQRYVTRAELLDTFQNKTFITLPPDMLQGLQIAATGAQLTPIEAIARDVAQIPLPRRAALRSEEVKRLQAHLISSGMLWFHGSSGLGKSTLAVLLARSQGVAWRFADLRELSASAIRSVLVGIASSFRQTGARGLILDDIPANADNALISAIGQVARAVADADGVLVVTSMKPPQPTLSGRLGLNADAIIRVPYLTEEDVTNMVRAAGGHPQKWARSIHAFAHGHPQLVDARVAGLEQRGWNEKEILADIVPLRDAPNDMAEERRAVRSRLLEELQPNAIDLLLRLSLLHGNFDRPMALVAAETPTAVPQAGLVFDFLVGPWIEQLGPERYRLSPLLKESGTVDLALPLQQTIKTNGFLTGICGVRNRFYRAPCRHS
jgi:hypothetical protein